MALEVTPEMRAAVAAEKCAEEGHHLAFDGMVVTKEFGRDVRNPDGQLAHIRCLRCDTVWIVVEEAGADYDDADKKYRGRLKDTDPRKKRK